MSLQNLAVVNTLQVFPFYDLDDDNWHFDELIISDLYNLLPNPDKNDDADPYSSTISNNVICDYIVLS